MNFCIILFYLYAYFNIPEKPVMEIIHPMIAAGNLIPSVLKLFERKNSSFENASCKISA